MASNGVSGVNTTRITGIVSGMDTDSLVKGMLKADQYKIDKLFREKTSIGWKKDSVKEMNALLLKFRTTYMSALSKDTNLSSTSAYKVFSVKSDDNNAVTISASAEAQEGSSIINSITSIATGASAASSAGIVGNTGLSISTKLKDVIFANPLSFVTPEGATEGQIKFKINDISFTFKQSDSLKEVFSQINNSAANVNMSYSSLSDGITLKSKTLGTTSGIKIENVDGNFFGTNSATKIDVGTINNGTNAVLDINGYNVEKNSNTFTVDGVTYTLTGGSTKPINYTVSRDLDTTVTKIKNFVSAYNELIDKLYVKYEEQKYSGYTPLTDEEKVDMSEGQIDKWEGIAKSGMFKSDKNLGTLISGLRKTFFTNVDGTNINTTNLGFTTGSYSENGKIYIDDVKLKQSLQDNPDDVAALFTNTGTAPDASVKFKESGIVSRLTSFISNYSVNETSSIYDYKISTISDRMEALTDMLATKETRYYAQFTRMEQVLAKMNTQSSWFSQQMNSSGG